MSEDSTADADDSRSDTGDPRSDASDPPPAADESLPSGAGRTLDVPGPGRFAVYVLVPAAVGTAVYWLVTDATLAETGIFGAVMVVMILAMDYLFDTIPAA